MFRTIRMEIYNFILIIVSRYVKNCEVSKGFFLTSDEAMCREYQRETAMLVSGVLMMCIFIIILIKEAVNCCLVIFDSYFFLKLDQIIKYKQFIYS